MDFYRKSGAKFVPVEANEYLHDPDFEQIVAREKAEHEAKLHQEKVKKAKLDKEDKKP